MLVRRVFFSLTLLFLSMFVGAHSLGPHFRLDQKAFENITLDPDGIIVLTRAGCAFCEEQLKKLECFPKEKIIILFNGTEDEWKVYRRKKPNSFKSYLSANQSLKLFKANPVYPSSLRYKTKKILRFEGVKPCLNLL